MGMKRLRKNKCEPFGTHISLCLRTYLFKYTRLSVEITAWEVKKHTQMNVMLMHRGRKD